MRVRVHWQRCQPSSARVLVGDWVLAWHGRERMRGIVSRFIIRLVAVATDVRPLICKPQTPTSDTAATTAAVLLDPDSGKGSALASD